MENIIYLGGWCVSMFENNVTNPGIIFFLILLFINYPSLDLALAHDDGFEENDTKSLATEVTEGVYEDLAFDNDDHDWYKVSISKGDNLTVIINLCDYDLERGLSLEDEDGTVIDSSSAIIDGGMTVHLENANHSSYYYIDAYAEDDLHYRMEITFSIVYPTDDVYVAQGVMDLNHDSLLNDGFFAAETRYAELPGVNITITHKHNETYMDSGITAENGEYDSFDLPNGMYLWEALFEGRIVGEGEFDISTGETGRNIHGVVGIIGDRCYYDDLNIWTYDHEGNEVPNEVITIYYFSNKTQYMNGTTNDEGNFLIENLDDGDYIVTISHEGVEYLSCRFKFSEHRTISPHEELNHESSTDYLGPIIIIFVLTLVIVISTQKWKRS